MTIIQSPTKSQGTESVVLKRILGSLDTVSDSQNVIDSSAKGNPIRASSVEVRSKAPEDVNEAFIHRLLGSYSDNNDNNSRTDDPVMLRLLNP